MKSNDFEHHLSDYAPYIEIEEIRRRLKPAIEKLSAECFHAYRQASDVLEGKKAGFLELTQDVVRIGRKGELSVQQDLELEGALRTFLPWKKGPFDVFGHQIDAEWRSDWKWGRIEGEISSLKGRRVADIGCHNGYFMFRMAAESPELVLGFEPYQKHWFNFKLLQGVAQLPCLDFQLLGVESIDLFPKFFDTVFCLGILYHHTDPVGILRRIYASMTRGAELIIDCQGIPGEESLSLTPKGRYARARGIWFLPTLSALENWLRRAHFRELECFFAEPLSCLEQRSTSWAPVDSLAEFLDPKDKTKTCEGYPAPWRFYVKAIR